MTMMMPIVMVMMLSQVSKLLEEGRLREGVVLVNYRLIVKIMMGMEMMLMMPAFYEMSHTHVIVTEIISGRRL